MSSESVSTILAARRTTAVTAGTKDLNTAVTTDSCSAYACTPAQVDCLVDDAYQAGVATLPRMRGWYCKAAYKLGSEVFIRSIALAKEGRYPAKLFSTILTSEMRKAENKKPQAVGGGDRH